MSCCVRCFVASPRLFVVVPSRLFVSLPLRCFAALHGAPSYNVTPRATPPSRVVAFLALATLLRSHPARAMPCRRILLSSAVPSHPACPPLLRRAATPLPSSRASCQAPASAGCPALLPPAPVAYNGGNAIRPPLRRDAPCPPPPSTPLKPPVIPLGTPCAARIRLRCLIRLRGLRSKTSILSACCAGSTCSSRTARWGRGSKRTVWRKAARSPISRASPIPTS